MFTDLCVTVVGNRLVAVNKSREIIVRHVHTPDQVVHTIRTVYDGDEFTYITPIPSHAELIVTAHKYGAVHLWDIGKQGARARECS
jgi:hypothetical protein